MVDDGDINYTGTWSSTGTYFASTKDTVLYGSTRYIAIVDNVGGVPTYVPRRGQAKWSSLVTISTSGTEAEEHTADEAYALAQQALSEAQSAGQTADQAVADADQAFELANGAYTIAVAGTNAAASAQAQAAAASSAAATAQSTAMTAQNTANGASAIAVTALETAWSGTAGVNQVFPIAVAGTEGAAAANALAYQALQTAWAGTTSYSETGWSGTLNVDLTGPTYQRLTIHGTTQINVINPAAVRGVTAILVSDIGIDAALNFMDGMIWFGQGAPEALPGGQRMIVNFTSFGSVASEIHAAYVQQA